MIVDAESDEERRDLLERVAWLADAAERHAERAGEELPECLRDAVRAEIAQAWRELDP